MSYTQKIELNVERKVKNIMPQNSDIASDASLGGDTR